MKKKGNWKRVSALSLVLASLALGGCSGAQDSSHATPQAQSDEKEKRISVTIGEYRPDFVREATGADPKLIEFLDQTNNEFRPSFPTEEYLPRTLDEWEPHASQWKFDVDGTASLGNGDLVFRYGGDQAFQVNAKDEYSNTALRWYCSWAGVLNEGFRNEDGNLVSQVKTEVERNDPSNDWPEVDSSVSEMAHKAFQATSGKDEFLTSFLATCEPFKRK